MASSGACQGERSSCAHAAVDSNRNHGRRGARKETGDREKAGTRAVSSVKGVAIEPLLALLLPAPVLLEKELAGSDGDRKRQLLLLLLLFAEVPLLTLC